MPATSPATISIGSSVSSHENSSNASGCSSTRGASSVGITSTASASAGTTSIVSRSSGIASYPVRYGRSAPVDSSSTSTPSSRMRARARASRSTYTSPHRWVEASVARLAW